MEIEATKEVVRFFNQERPMNPVPDDLYDIKYIKLIMNTEGDFEDLLFGQPCFRHTDGFKVRILTLVPRRDIRWSGYDYWGYSAPRQRKSGRCANVVIISLRCQI